MSHRTQNTGYLSTSHFPHSHYSCRSGTVVESTLSNTFLIYKRTLNGIKFYPPCLSASPVITEKNKILIGKSIEFKHHTGIDRYGEAV